MEYSDDVLKKVQIAWSSHKDAKALSQASAAKAMGMNQSAFSQYLRGTIPLNTNFLAKFTAFTGTELSDFGALAGSIKEKPLQVLHTLSGRKPSISSMLVETILECDSSYFVEVDYADFSLRKGSMLLVNPKSNIRAGDMVVYHRKKGQPIVFGELMETEEGWEILEQLWQGGRRYLVDPKDDVFRVVSVYNPSAGGKKFK
ncbi:MAG: helix-turn-helix transcriptional regulator [Pseudoalteromonas distincta]|uniref:helix-turn-helix domain-containing protein n=1 Tax=Pseudoalteromonas distincta TaxID=77608 RepID=UPI003002BFA2